MKISVIIPTREGIPRELRDNLFNQIYKPDEIIEVIGSALTIQRNEGIKQAKGDIVIFIDDDMMLDKWFIFWLRKTFYWYPDAMAVSANPLIKSYKPNLLYDIYARLFMLTYRSKGIYQKSGFPQNYHPKINKVIKSEMLHGCCMAVKKEVFARYSFNEKLISRMYGEDDYFANEIIKDHPIYYCPYAICYDNRPYPRGRQAIKIRSTLYNLVIRHKMKQRTWFEKGCFLWAMVGFILFKMVEAFVMKDLSIIKGLFLCFAKWKNRSLEEIRKEIKIRKICIKP